MIMTRPKFFVERAQYNKSLRIYATVQTPGDLAAMGLPPAFRVLEDGEALTEPMLEVRPEDAISLMDELWLAGVRPTSVGTGGELEATKHHLNDMRRAYDAVLELMK